MENRKKFKNYRVQEKLSKGVNAIEVNNEGAGTTFIHENNFISFVDVEIGKVYKLEIQKGSNGNEYYSENWKLFDYDYQKKNFKDKTIYKGKVVKVFGKRRDRVVVKVNSETYILLPLEEFDKEGIEIGQEIDFLAKTNRIKTRYYFSHYEANFSKFCDKMRSQGKENFNLLLLDIQEKKGRNGEISGYDYKVYSEEDDFIFVVFIPLKKRDDYFLRRNYEIKKNLLNKETRGYFKFFNGTRINLNPGAEFHEKLAKEERLIVKLKKNEFDPGDMSIYIEDLDIGLMRLNLSKYSLVELTLLDTLENQYISVIKDGGIKIEPLNLNIDEDIENVVVAKTIIGVSGNIFYQLASKDLNEKNYFYNRFFIEEKDVDYLQDIIEEGRIFEKLKYKYSVNDIFHFYTRLPYLKNPLLDIVRDKKEGDTVLGRVRKIGNNFIDVILDGKYRKTVAKDKLKNLSIFSINEFYEEGKLYEFYINEIKEDDIEILGYNPKKLKVIKDRINIEDIINCSVKQNLIGLRGIYEEDGEYISCTIPKEELSYSGRELNFKENLLYQFKVLSKTKDGLILSRKRLSKNIKLELEKEYPVNSILEGIYFAEDENGFFFNMASKDRTRNMGNIVGYLPFNKIGLYPDKDKFRRHLSRNSFLPYRVLAYPKAVLVDSLDLKEKSILLGLAERTENIEDIFSSINFSNFSLNLKNMNEEKMLTKKEGKVYFTKEIEDVDVVFSIDVKEFLFEDLTPENFLEKLGGLYEHLRGKENSIYKKILKLFRDNFSNIKVSFKDIDISNNTIEVSFKEKIKEALLGMEVIQNKNAEYLLNDDVLRIPVEIVNVDRIEDGDITCRIEEFKEGRVELVPQLKDVINQTVKAKVIKKIKDNNYLGEILNQKIFINSENLLKAGETVYVRVQELLEEGLVGEVVIYNNELVKNPSVLIEEFLMSNIQKLDLEFMKDLMLKSDNTSFIEILSRNKSKIFAGKKINEYIFENEEFSSGAFGKIYKGENLLTGEKVVLKSYSASKSIPEYHSFNSEARLLSELNEDSVMKVYWYDDDNYIGEFIDGKLYREFLNEDKKYNEKIAIFLKICKAVDSIHEQNIIHLDLKPENIMIGKDNKIKLIDFGCSQSKYEKYGKYGTLLYASPDQCEAYTESQNVEFTIESDIYSLGIMMYETFVGKLPYPSELGEDGIIKGHILGRTESRNVEYKYINPKEINENIPKDLEDIINNCLDKEYEDVYDLIEELEKII